MGNSVPSKLSSVTSDQSSCMIYGTYLEPRHVKKMSREVARYKTKAKHLSLLSCSLGDCCGDVFAEKLSKFLQDNTQLEWVHLTGPLLLENNAQAFVVLQALETMTSLQRLSFCFGKPANEDVGYALGLLIAKSSHLKTLNLSNISWRNTEALEHLARGLTKAKELQVLDLSNCRISDSGLKLIVDALSFGDEEGAWCHLRTLTLRGNHFTSKSLIHLAKLLSTLIQLERLDVGHTALFENPSSEEIQSFLQGLKHNDSLLTLNFAKCKMDELTMPLLMPVMLTNKNIRCLDISNNPFINKYGGTMRCLKPILPLLHGLETLRVESRMLPNSVDMTVNSIKTENEDSTLLCEHFLDALNKNASLTHIMLDEGSKALLAQHDKSKNVSLGHTLSVCKINDILQRNLMTNQMRRSRDAVSLSSLPVFVERRLRQGRNGKAQEHHGPSVVFQLLEHHVAKILSFQDNAAV
ncbi:hypothetical protein ACA910_004330 [Epithemia clementina (nom. ined.)]